MTEERLRKGLQQQPTITVAVNDMRKLIGMAHYTASNLLYIRLLEIEKTHSRSLKEALKNDIKELQEHIEIIENMKQEIEKTEEVSHEHK